ncbi:hypothetical protein [Roseospirillum parvum]|uniref:Dolichyl-phosphate-mannose-protein mannosyltransferase n=1 Tax=Roseospirillum parvum TaxID=83401 RepID=A0A1G8BVV2_9PROT|nr:hypothetical protein [Roseospirillum parvum]SDH37238.1 hypothetical protein SAMN05421742_106134 [Roseospirillum parvum]
MRTSLAVVLVALSVVGAVLFLAADFGHRINDLPVVAEGPSPRPDMSGSALERDSLVGQAAHAEGPERWRFRYRLYSVHSDEIVNFVAFARLKRGLAEGRPDPGIYQYGGAYLYPMAAWLVGLDRLGLVEIGGLTELVDDPQRMDRLYLAGRTLVLLAALSGGLFVYLGFSALGRPWLGGVVALLQVLTPMALLAETTMKPHWYATLWAGLAFFALARLWAGTARPWPWLGAAALGTGLAVGATLPLGAMAVVLWGFLVALAVRRAVPWVALLAVPVGALLVFAATNPFLFLNHAARTAEQGAALGFYDRLGGPAEVLAFFWNSLVPGLGLGLLVALGLATVVALARPERARLLLLAAVWGPLLAMGVLTGALVEWTQHARYLPFIVPLIGLLLAAVLGRRALPVAGAVLVLTLVQSVPQMVARFDEDSPRHGTRLAAAAWIDTQVPAEPGICAPSHLAPFQAPPFDFARLAVNRPDCACRVRVAGSTVRPHDDPWPLAAEFAPRLRLPGLPPLYDHVNPRITVHCRPDFRPAAGS